MMMKNMGYMKLLKKIENKSNLEDVICNLAYFDFIANLLGP